MDLETVMTLTTAKGQKRLLIECNNTPINIHSVKNKSKTTQQYSQLTPIIFVLSMISTLHQHYF